MTGRGGDDWADALEGVAWSVMPHYGSTAGTPGQGLAPSSPSTGIGPGEGSATVPTFDGDTSWCWCLSGMPRRVGIKRRRRSRRCWVKLQRENDFLEEVSALLRQRSTVEDLGECHRPFKDFGRELDCPIR